MGKILTMEKGQEIFVYNFNRLYKAWGKSQKTLSEEIGVTQSRISYWVHGMAMPTFVNLYNLSVVFGCEICEFYKELPTEKEDEQSIQG